MGDYASNLSEEVIEELVDTPKETIIAHHTDIDFIY